ncbi:MAG: cytochrome P450 [Burkholderiales bacterium]|nr:cytochrome P450 [Burkholderiales bacterium]
METLEAPAPANAATLRELADLPGPPGIPVLGTLHKVRPPILHRQLEGWSRDYGPYYRLRLAKRNLLVVGDHEAVAGMLRDRPDGFRRSDRLEHIGAEMGLDPGVFGSEGEAWRRQRRMVMAGFDPAHVKAYFPSMARVVRRLEGRWRKAAAADGAIDLQADLMRYTVDTIAGLAFGAEVNTLESGEDVIQQHLDRIFPALFRRILAPFAYWRFVKLPADRALDRSIVEVKAAIAGFIAAARARLAADPARRADPPNLLEAMLVAAAAPDSGVTDREVAGNVMTMLLAGEDTTANTLAWMIYLLDRHPEALARARAEVLAHAPDSAAFSHEQMGRLDYLEACAHETMRLKPVAPFNSLVALRDTVVGDVRVPKGTPIFCLLRRDSIDERFVPQAAQFRPERWLAEGGPAAVANSAKRISMPFGAGPRVCPGRYLAMLEIKLAMAMLLGRFDIAHVATPDGGEARETLAFTMYPDGLTMRLRTRT